ncbi:centromere DNA-binding like protein [Nitzschia inconspicua]|uniref:Centromere DNA-binding like protein n=1 Tax=Nitzschia inconspicua TaxID=303405 RepID=A0A9K3PM09_9STRA|nr:centromere DNA-binding like protein [Nitzschia inconspicua]
MQLKTSSSAGLSWFAKTRQKIMRRQKLTTPDQRVEDPKVCLGLESIMSYKAALQKFHADLRDDNINNCSWQDHVWLAKCGILRGESVYMAELSDLLHATVQRTRDPHPVTVMILQMATGKTNKDLKLYGRVARHKNVNLCSIWCSWFLSHVPFPLYCDSRRGSPLNHTQRISDKSYAKAIKKVCKSLGITTRHFLHIGRVLGNKESEIMEDDDNLRRTLGNWDPKQNEKAYSNKLPMKIIRQKAGFREAEGLHYNPRVAVIPPTSLTEKVFPCLSDTFHAFTGLSEISPEDDKVTATRFLHFMKVLSEVVIQDAAVIFVEHPNRIHHPLFSSVEVFQSNEFKSYVELMRASLTHATSPYTMHLWKLYCLD